MTGKDFKKILAEKKIFILDGATGSNLMKAGMPNNICPELWIIENSGIVEDLQRRYAESGSMAVSAPTFGANRESLKRYGLEARTEEINRTLVEITKNAVGGKAYVMGDISPSGLFMKPYGEASFEQIYDIFYEQAAILDSAGVDMFVIETQMSLAETRAALLAVKDVCGKPVLTCMTVDERGATISGNKISVCLLALSSLGADAVGCNCSLGPKLMRDILNGAKDFSYAPLIAKANAGKPHGTGKDMMFDVDAYGFADACAEIAGIGVKIIGGCCGTTPEYISLLKDFGEREAGEVEGKVKEENINIALTAANEKDVFEIDASVFDGDINIIDCSLNLEDDIMDALDDGAEIIRLRVNDEKDADILLENSFLINKPLALSGDEKLLDAVLRKYAGRAVIDPECKLGEESVLQGKYNPVRITMESLF